MPESNQPPLLEYPSNKTIESMLNLLPDLSTGAKVHELVINKQARELPGQHTPPKSSSMTFRQSFYEHYGELPHARFMETDTGLPQYWWEGFSVSLLCQAIYSINKTVAKQLDGNRIYNAVTQSKDEILQHLYLCYGRALKEFGPFATLLDELNRQQLDGKALFHDAMLQNVGVWRLWMTGGHVTNPDWHLFNNYAKYIALGASGSEVDDLIEELDKKDLPIQSMVDKSHWRGYTNYLQGQPSFDYTSIDAMVRTAVLAGYTYVVGSKGAGQPRFKTENNYYSGEFIKKGQPGRKFVK